MRILRKIGFLTIFASFLTVTFSANTFAQDVAINLSSLGGPVCSFTRYGYSGGEMKKWVQGFAVTEKYCVYGYVNSDSSYSHIIVQDRSNGSIAADHSVGWGHVNTLHYDWQNNQIWVEGGGCLNGTTAAIENCRISGPRGYNFDGSLTGQGRDAVNNIGFMAMSDNNNCNLAKLWLCPATSECNSPTHTITISGFGSGELEDVSFDKNGDVLVSFNRWDKGTATAEVYRIDKSVFANLGVNTVPVGSASTINADGSTGGSAAPSTPPDSSDPPNPSTPSTPSDSSDPSAPAGVTMETPDGSNCANFLKAFCPNGGKDVTDLPKLIVDILMAGVVVAGTIGIIICGYTILTARDDVSKVEKAKRRLFEIVIGLVLLVLGSLLISFFLPGADASLMGLMITKVVLL